MAKTGPEYGIVFAILGVLTAIGVPAIRRGQVVRGWLCIVFAGAVLIWGGLSIWRAFSIGANTCDSQTRTTFDVRCEWGL